MNPDPALVAALVSALASGFVAVGDTLIKKGVIEPALKTPVEAIEKIVTKGVEKAKKDNELREIVQRATSKLEITPEESLMLSMQISRLSARKNKDTRSVLVNAILMMTDPDNPPDEVLQLLRVPKDEKPKLLEFLSVVRKEIAASSGEYAGYILYANQVAGLQIVRDSTQQILKKLDSLPDAVADRVVKRLEPRLPEPGITIVEPDSPKVPSDIQALFDEGLALRAAGQYEDARTLFQQSLELATSYEDNLTAAKSKYYLAMVLDEWDRDYRGADTLLQQSLKEFRSANAEKDIASALYLLGGVNINVGQLDEAKAYVSQAIELWKGQSSKSDLKFHIAAALHQLGWIEDHRGQSKEALELYDQALTYFLSVLQEEKAEQEQDILGGIAGCYLHKGLVYEHQGNVTETEANYIRALDWFRRSGHKLEVGNVLYLLAQLLYRLGRYDDGTKYLDEATAIYESAGYHAKHAACLDLKGRLFFTLGQREKAIFVLESAFAASEKSNDYHQQQEYLIKLGHVHLETRDFDQAKKYFERARILCLHEGLLNGYAESLEGLAAIAISEKDEDERNRLLFDGIRTLEKVLLSVQAEPKQAFILGQIGSFYEKMEDYRQALVHYQRAKKAFEALSDIHGVANSLGAIARMKGLLGERHEEFNLYQELRTLVAGSPYYDLIAGTAINLAEIHMQIGNLDEAKILLEEAESLCREYHLRYLPFVEKSIERLRNEIDLNKPQELNFKQLLEELFELVDWFPEAKDSILRLWLWERRVTLQANIRSAIGVKLMLFQDDLDTFTRTLQKLHPYLDLCLQVVSSEYPGAALDMVPFPLDKEIFFDCAIPLVVETADGLRIIRFARGGPDSRYFLTSDKATSQLTGNEAVVITGWTLGLPEQAHDLILSASAADLLQKKAFFLPYQRHLSGGKLITDLRVAHDLGLIPVYFSPLPRFEDIRVLASTTIDLPIIFSSDDTESGRQVRRIRQRLSQLVTTTKDSAQSALNDLVFEIEEMADQFPDQETLEIQVLIVMFPNPPGKESHAVLVINDDNSPGSMQQAK